MPIRWSEVIEGPLPRPTPQPRSTPPEAPTAPESRHPHDGSVNTLDVLAFLNAGSSGDPSADINGDGNVNTLDVLAFLNLWSVGC